MAVAERSKSDSQGRLAQAWYVGQFSRMKRLPSLRRLLEPEGHVATPEEFAESQAAYDEVMAALEDDMAAHDG